VRRIRGDLAQSAHAQRVHPRQKADLPATARPAGAGAGLRLPAEQGRAVSIHTLPHAHGDFHVGLAVVSVRDATGLGNRSVLSALARKGLLLVGPACRSSRPRGSPTTRGSPTRSCIHIAKEVHWVTAIDHDGVMRLDRKLESRHAFQPNFKLAA
jgi:hypothetical protein